MARLAPMGGLAGAYWTDLRLAGLGKPRSRANRSAVRFRAAASDAFLARAVRSSGVMFFAAVLPPSLPYACPTLRRYSATSFGIRVAMARA